jgi:PAS domain S-box-containing protein
VHESVRTVAWLTAYVGACLLGRITVIGPESIGLVWPAAGVALVWLASGNTRRTWFLDIALLSVSTFLVLLLTDGGLGRSILSLVTVFQAVITVLALRRWVPGIWGTGGRVPYKRLHDFGFLLLVVIATALLTALLRTLLGLAFLPGDGFDLLLGRWGRNAAAMATIGSFGLLLGGWIAEHRDVGARVLVRPTRTEWVHGTGIVATVLAVVAYGFWRDPAVAPTFILTLTSVWAGLRFNALVAAGQSLLTGALVVWLTILGYGPITNVEGAEARALTAQIFVIVLMVTSLTIALSRRQIAETIGRLETSEATLAVRAEELDMMMSRLQDGVAIIEEGGRVVHANEALLTAFGSRPAEPLERVPDQDERKGQAFHPNGRPLEEEQNAYVRAMAGEVVDAEEVHHIDEHGVSRVLEVSAFPVPHAEGASKRVMMIIRDVTAASTHRESLAAFAGTVAHDLNNPLSVIDGWAEALEDELAHSDSREAVGAAPMVQHIRVSVGQMRGLISGLLAHSMARDQALDLEQVSLRNQVKHIIATYDQPRGGGEIVAGDLLDVWADRVLLRQVLDNLIGNALKYVAPGTVPRVVIEAEEATEGWACVKVRDNGIGVPPAHRERIFESFQRASGENYRGTGLGLAICRRIIQRHGGSIHVTDNRDGVGSTFEFTLPTTPTAFNQALSSTPAEPKRN